MHFPRPVQRALSADGAHSLFGWQARYSFCSYAIKFSIPQKDKCKDGTSCQLQRIFFAGWKFILPQSARLTRLPEGASTTGRCLWATRVRLAPPLFCKISSFPHPRRRRTPIKNRHGKIYRDGPRIGLFNWSYMISHSGDYHRTSWLQNTTAPLRGRKALYLSYTPGFSLSGPVRTNTLDFTYSV